MHPYGTDVTTATPGPTFEPCTDGLLSIPQKNRQPLSVVSTCFFHVIVVEAVFQKPYVCKSRIGFNADFRRAKTINIFESAREAHGYWKTTGRFRNQGIVWRGWSREAFCTIGLRARLSKCTTIRSGWISTTPPVSTNLRYSCLGAAVSKPRSCLASQR